MSKHMKRLASPPAWAIPRKTNVYTTKPRPGAHPQARGLPLGTVLRDYLQIAKTGREAQRVIGAGEVQVDGRVVKDAKFVVGFMDAIHVPKMNKAWRVMVDDHARLRVAPIDAAAAAWKLAQIVDKSTVRGGRTQLHLHDGRNLLVKKDDYHTGDVLRLEVPAQKIVGHFPLGSGAQVFITAGRHAGEIAPVKSIEVTRSHKPNLIHLTGDGASFTTIKPYAFPIGEASNLPAREAKAMAGVIQNG